VFVVLLYYIEILACVYVHARAHAQSFFRYYYVLNNALFNM